MVATRARKCPADEALSRRLAGLQALADMEAAQVPRPVFRCATCARQLCCTPRGAARLLAGGWPVCCARPMAVRGADPVNVTDSPLRPPA
jgi:hypothetical protein